MTGLNLETLLRILRADMGAWASLAMAAVILAVMTWTSWGSKRALRKCLFLSIAAHVGLVVYGGASPEIRKSLRLDRPESPARPEQPVRIIPVVADRSASKPGGVSTSKRVADWDLDRAALALEAPGRLEAPAALPRDLAPGRVEPAAVSTPSVAPDVQAPPPILAAADRPAESRPAQPAPTVAESDPSEVAPPVATTTGSIDVPLPPVVRPRSGTGNSASSRSAPERSRPPTSGLPEAAINFEASRVASGPEKLADGSRTSQTEEPAATVDVADPAPPVERSPVIAPRAIEASPSPGIRRPAREVVSGSTPPIPARSADAPNLALARVTPTGPSTAPTAPRPFVRRSLSDVPPVYRSRLDPNRTVLAQRAGATEASEQAVERALDWLARHQDALDGRWDGGTARLRDGSVAPDEDSFTIHCPAGEVCFGECFYWEADTALTGLSLLAFLGSGYTHLDGKYAPVVAKGLDFLLKSQKSDGDLRGLSQAVGMYCHAMATLAICEAYALTGDVRLRLPVEKAASFLVKSRAVDGLAWRYAPGAPTGDTSILGWVVMALKSARTVGVPIPPETQAGILGWLRKVSRGSASGLAFYNFDPSGTKITPTMTAEAWACRQFLEVGGPGPVSDEAAAYLIENGSDRGVFNIYYLYYGTLAMYQHGGDAWSTWNGRVRDEVVRRQRSQGHMAGSWDPDDSPYGTKGGRIYGTALATLTLEVYYRFLRLYEPSPPAVAPAPADGGARRAGLPPRPNGR